MLGAVLRAGYDRSFETLGVRPDPALSPLRSGAAGIVVDEDAGTVRLPVDVGFDPGGIGKGLAADLVVAEVLAEGAAGACVNLGGDMRVDGAAPDGRRLAHRHRGPTRRLAAHRRGGGRRRRGHELARLRRRWFGPDRTERHHLIDPARGTSAATPVLAATAVAAEGWQAEVLAKAAFLRGSDGLALLHGLGVAGLVVETDRIQTTSGWGRFGPGAMVGAAS